MGESRISLIIVFSLILCSFLGAGVCRADYAVGVQAGEWIRYDIESSQQIAPAASYWIKITVVNVTGTVVLLHGESNITGSIPQDWSEDVASDCLGVARDLPYVIPENLSAGDVIPEGVMSLTVTDTPQHDGRDTVHFISGFGYEMYWDRKKGVLLEYTLFVAGGTTSLTMKVADTNMWGSGFLGAGLEWWVWAVIIVVVVVVTAGAVSMLWRRKPRAPAPSVQTSDLPPPPRPPP
jgi:hypothetical protein